VASASAMRHVNDDALGDVKELKKTKTSNNDDTTMTTTTATADNKTTKQRNDDDDDNDDDESVQRRIGDATNQCAKASQSVGGVRPGDGVHFSQPNTSHLVRFPALAATFYVTTQNLIKHFIDGNKRGQQMETTAKLAQINLKSKTETMMRAEPKNVRKKLLKECNALCSVIDHTLLKYNNDHTQMMNMMNCLLALSIYRDAYSTLIDDKTYAELLADGSLEPAEDDDGDEDCGDFDDDVDDADVECYDETPDDHFFSF